MWKCNYHNFVYFTKFAMAIAYFVKFFMDKTSNPYLIFEPIS